MARGRRTGLGSALAAIALVALLSLPNAEAARDDAPPGSAAAGLPKLIPPAPRPAVRPNPRLAPAVAAPQAAPMVAPAAALVERLRRVNAVRSWGYQLAGARQEQLAASPYDLLVVDATTGRADGRPFTRAEVEALKRKPDGSRRLVVSYLSIGEAEDYRPDYFHAEYMEEDAPDWLLRENPDWKGNRLIKFCTEGWQQTMLGDATGRSVYDSIQPSPLYRLIEAGFDGVYLDRVDVYEEIRKECPDGERRMVDFVVRLAAHARKADPYFLVIQQNAEELLNHPRMIEAIDAVGKESLFYGWGGGDGSNSIAVSPPASIKWSVDRMNKAKAAGRAIFVIDYARNRAASDTALRRNRELGYVPYIGPKALNALWLPGREF